jgi:hypothetical protein
LGKVVKSGHELWPKRGGLAEFKVGNSRDSS